ncbi:MAG: hypothetical protein ACLP6E_05585 [Acidimicrobiales bacterium]
MTSTSGSNASTLLDEAYDRMHLAGFELPNGFVNHGPMACEALAALGCDEDIDSWARRFSVSSGNAVEPVEPHSFEWFDALGDYGRLPEWIGYFDARIASDGWRAVVHEWVPRLFPGLAVALFHGEIRVAHAVRAIGASDTEARRHELARSLGYWAARFRPGESTEADAAREVDPVANVVRQVLDVAANSAKRYLARPDIFNLHGVTSAMALEMLAPHLTESAVATGLEQLRADHSALYGDASVVSSLSSVDIEKVDLARVAAASSDPHQVKLVEACRRGFNATADPAFAAAAALVTGLI